MTALPETILQFGAGRFLRAFADLFVHQANQAGQQVGQIAVVQSTGDDRARLLNARQGRYHVVIRGFAEGEVIDRVEECASIRRALVATEQWEEIRALACTPTIRYFLSNTTEAGYQLDPTDQPDQSPPRSFPAKLLQLLRDRHAAGSPPPVIIPCELLEGNAQRLRQTVLDLGQTWNYPTHLLHWIEHDCRWLHTLVDRIVSGTPKEHPLLAEDPLLLVAEPYALFALEDHPDAPFAQHPAIVRTPDVAPFFLRKVRILNAAHTALLIRAVAKGHALVRQAMDDEELCRWLEQLLFSEIVPTLEGRVEDGETFARQTLDRFRNPFLDHKFADIALHHANKVQVRLSSTQQEYVDRFAKRPPLLDELLARPEAFHPMGNK